MKKSVFRIIATISLVILIAIIFKGFSIKGKSIDENSSEDIKNLPEGAKWIVEKIDLSEVEKINLLE